MDRERLRRAVERVLRPPNESIHKLGSRTSKNQVKSETTILAFRYESGIICAADRQVTLSDGCIMGRDFKKIFKAGSNSFVLGSGSVASVQEVSRQLKIRCKEFEDDHAEVISVQGQAKFLARLCREAGDDSCFFGILAGVNRDERHYMFRVDDDGSILTGDPYLAYGSGYEAATVTLDTLWKRYWADGLTLTKGIELAIRAIAAAAKLDTQSSDPSVAPPSVAIISSAGALIDEDIVQSTHEAWLRKESVLDERIDHELREEREDSDE